MSARIAVGIVRKPHGVRGEASVEAWTDSLDRFEELSDVTLVSPDESLTREERVESSRVHGGRALLKFAGIDSPEDIQSLQNWTIEIPEAEARQLDKDEYFLHDLVGLQLFDEKGRERGVITDVIEGGGGILFAVRRPDGKTFELPFAADLCKQIELEGKRMVVNLPEGLDDLEAIEE